MAGEPLTARLRSVQRSLDPDESGFVLGLADLLDELALRMLDDAASEVTRGEVGAEIVLAHRERGRIVWIESFGDVVVSYGAEHEHFEWEDAEVGRIWPFHEDDHVAQALSFVRYLVTGRIELDVWYRPLAVKTRSYWIDEDGDRQLFLRGGTLGAFFGWSKEPEVQRFDFTA